MTNSQQIPTADTHTMNACPRDFTTGYVGQAAAKTREVFERALGQVLFVDEAYRSVSCQLVR